MSDLTLLVLRIGFLLLLWLFIFAIVYALKSDLFGAPVRKLPNDGSPARGGGAPPAGSPAPAPIIPALPNQMVTAPAPSVSPAVASLSIPSAGGAQATARVLTIVSGVATGTTIPLDEDVITIGRSSDSSLVIVDEYTSTYHARLKREGTSWVLTDLDSTNGTTLDGQPVNTPVNVPLFTPITIGTTTFELRA